MEPKYQYAVEVVQVVDGDTIDVIIDLGFSISFGNRKVPQRLRIADINTPELNDPDADVRARALSAKSTLQGYVFNPDGTTRKAVVITRKTRVGKEYQTFGRWVADVYVETSGGVWENVADLLVTAGLAERV